MQIFIVIQGFQIAHGTKGLMSACLVIKVLKGLINFFLPCRSLIFLGSGILLDVFDRIPLADCVQLPLPLLTLSSDRELHDHSAQLLKMFFRTVIFMAYFQDGLLFFDWRVSNFRHRSSELRGCSATMIATSSLLFSQAYSFGYAWN